MLALATEVGVQQAIDWWLVERFGELVAYKASPPLATSPQGEGRDSDNDESYDQTNLLLQDTRDSCEDHDEECSADARFALLAPESGALVEQGEPLQIRGEVLVQRGNARFFAHRHALARVCLDVHRLQHAAQPLQMLEQPLCQGLRSVLQGAPLAVPGATLRDEGWYLLTATLLAFDGADEPLSSTSVVFEARNSRDDVDPLRPPQSAFPPRKTSAAHRRLAPIDVQVDGKAQQLDCAAARSIFDCVRDFCGAHQIQPARDCMARLAALFSADLFDDDDTTVAQVSE